MNMIKILYPLILFFSPFVNKINMYKDKQNLFSKDMRDEINKQKNNLFQTSFKSFISGEILDIIININNK